MKKSFNILLLAFTFAVIIANLSACVIDSTEKDPDNTVTDTENKPGENENQPNENSYFPIHFESGVESISIPSKIVKYGTKVTEPEIDFHDGYIISGWYAADSEELYSFDTPVTESLTLFAVWEKVVPGLIYSNKTHVTIIHDGSEATANLANTMKEEMAKLSVNVTVGNDGSREKYHEIVIGNTARDISKKAYEELKKFTDGKDNIAYLIYSDGKSVAFVYNEVENSASLEFLKELIMEKYIAESLNLEEGICDNYSVSVYNYYKEIDKENNTKQWQTLEYVLKESIGDEKAAEFISALKDLYSLYTPAMTEWYARLYDPDIGGFYYSNSAKNNYEVKFPASSSSGKYYQLLPDIESTNQALNFLISSGMLKNYGEELPAFMRSQIVAYIKGCQDPNGYFYNPQWPKEMTDSKISRRSRDLMWAENILQKFSESPYYTTPNGMQGSNAKSASFITPPLAHSITYATSKVISSSTVTNVNLKNKESFEAYLKGFETNSTRNIFNHSYSIGNELTAQSYEILERDRQLAAEGADYRLMDILIAWLNKHQNPETGHWHHTSNYYGTNGLLKISGIYNEAKVPMPNAAAAAKSAIDSITSDEPMGAVVDLYNTWFTVKNVIENLRKYGTFSDNILADNIVKELRASAPAAILKSKEKISAFQKPDGSFSYGPVYSSSTSQGMPVALPNSYEGDVNATGIASTGIISYMMSALGLGNYKPALFGKAEFYNYIRIIEGKEISKDYGDFEIIDFENGSIPSNVTSNLVSENSSVYIKNENDNQKLVFKTSAGGNDSLVIQTVSMPNVKTSVFSSDISISNISSGDPLYQIMFDSASGTRAYMLVIGYRNGALTISDCSSTGDGSTRREQLILSGVKTDEEFNLGIEYSKTGENVKISVLINGETVFISNNFYNSHKSGTTPEGDLAKMRFYTLNAASATLTVDNIIFTQITSE